MTPKQQSFVDEYLIDLNATQAAIRAGYSAKTAEQQGPRLLGNVEIAAALQAALAARSERTKITADDVLRELWAIGTADPNELIEFRRTCCRHCFGNGFAWQRTQVEYDRDYERWLAESAKESSEVGEFNEAGGVGYDARLAPNLECPECFGQGVGHAYVKDTRDLSPSARRLYAGVKVTKDGLEVKMHDKAAALVNVGKHLGMFTDRHEFSGPDGGPIQTSVKVEFVDAGEGGK